MKVAIFGSCVSRDPFGRSTEVADLKIVDYFARTSFASQSGKRGTTGFDLSNIKSPFQRKMVERDLEKSVINELINQEYDVLLIDFIDDRFDLIKTSDTLITNSVEFSSGKFDLINPSLIPAYSEAYTDLWIKGFNLFTEAMKSRGISSKILFNCVLWSEIDDVGNDFESINSIHRANQYLNKIYDFLLGKFPSHQFIQYKDFRFIGKSEHKWGRSPFHYIEEIENHCLRSVMNFHLSRKKKSCS